MTRNEISINHSQTVVATGDALNVVVPAGKAGVIAVDGVPHGLRPAGGDGQLRRDRIGTIFPRSYVFAASYAATFGSRFSAGLTYKFIQERVDCSGACANVPAFSASTNALDLGVQAVVDKERRLTLGLDIRDAGLTLQVNDAPQADPLPTRIHLGAQYLVPNIEKSIPDGELRVSAEVVDGSVVRIVRATRRRRARVQEAVLPPMRRGRRQRRRRQRRDRSRRETRRHLDGLRARRSADSRPTRESRRRISRSGSSSDATHRAMLLACIVFAAAAAAAAAAADAQVARGPRASPGRRARQR